MRMSINWEHFAYKDIAEMISADEINKMVEVMIENCDRNGVCYGLGHVEEFFREHVHTPAVIAMIDEVARKEINSNSREKGVMKLDPSNPRRFRERDLIHSGFKANVKLHLQKEDIYEALLAHIAQFARSQRAQRVFSRLHIDDKVCLDKLVSYSLFDDLVEFYKDGGWGIADVHGKVIVKNHLISQPSKTQRLFKDNNSPFLIIQDRDTELYGVLSLKTYKEVIHCLYRTIEVIEYRNDNTMKYLIKVMQNGKWGCYDDNCSFIIECRYDIIDVINGLIECGRDGDILFPYDNNKDHIYNGVKDLYNSDGFLMLGGYNHLEIHDNKYFKFYFGTIYERISMYPFGCRINGNHSLCLVLDTHFNSIIINNGRSFQMPLGKVFQSKQDLESFCPQEFLLPGCVDLSDYPSFVYIKRYDVDHFFISNYIEGSVREVLDDFILEKGRWVDEYIEDDEVIIIRVSEDGKFSWRAKVNELGPLCNLGHLYRLGDKVGYYWNSMSNPLYSAISTDYHNGIVYAAEIIYQKGGQANSSFIDYSNNIIQFYEISADGVKKIEEQRSVFNPRDHNWFPYDFLERTGLNDIGGGAYDSEDDGYRWTLEDSWDAMTDGMYGDMPSNPMDYDAMMDSMGF